MVTVSGSVPASPPPHARRHPACHLAFGILRFPLSGAGTPDECVREPPARGRTEGRAEAARHIKDQGEREQIWKSGTQEWSHRVAKAPSEQHRGGGAQSIPAFLEFQIEASRGVPASACKPARFARSLRQTFC